MIYEYLNEELNEVIEREFPMSGEIPDFIEESGKRYDRIFSSAVHIPVHFTQNRPFKYDKSPSGKKHFY